MRHRLSQLALACALSALSTACTSFGFQSQDIVLRHLEAEDALELRIVYFGLNEGDSKAADAVSVLERIGRRGKHFILYGWPWELDANVSLEDEDDESPATKQLYAWLTGFEVLDAGIFQDRRGRPAVWQALRFSDASLGIELINTYFGELLLESLGLDDAPFGDPSLLDAYLEAVSTGHRWVALERGCLRVEFPTSGRATAQLLREIADNPDEWRALLEPLSKLDVESDSMTLSYEPGPEGWVPFRFEFPDEEPSEPLAASLAADPELLRAPPDWVRALEER